MTSTAARCSPAITFVVVQTTSSPAATVERIQLTRELQAIGFTLADAVDALAAHDAGGATCESEQWRLRAVLDRVDAKLAELNALRRQIAQAQDACDAGQCKFATPSRAE